ncbi:LPS-assembly lipoprotein LptE [Thiosocius teredinicola]|uniref:LPS-assembly lipoprotein LptE n=1 Tax=Thiosocius teredinicola TaxID=1973002 RepID=UPI000990F78B
MTLVLRITALLLAASFLLTGCGFQPRGQAHPIDGIPGPIYIAGVQPYSDIYRELKKQLDIAGVAIAPDAQSSQTTLRIIRWKRDRRVLSLNSRNKVVEYEMEETVRFSLRNPDGGERVPPQLIRVVRIQFNPQDAILGSEREGELLREDMLRELVERMLGRLAAQS